MAYEQPAQEVVFCHDDKCHLYNLGRVTVHWQWPLTTVTSRSILKSIVHSKWIYNPHTHNQRTLPLRCKKSGLVQRDSWLKIFKFCWYLFTLNLFQFCLLLRLHIFHKIFNFRLFLSQTFNKFAVVL